MVEAPLSCADLYKWPDLGRLCTGMLPNDRVTALKYYTARPTFSVKKEETLLCLRSKRVHDTHASRGLTVRKSL
jgi:hypothetical protein